MKLNILAWRNLWRHKRRTLITASSIAFGVLLAVTFTGAGDYFYTRMIDAGANMGMGHISLTAPDYNRAPSSKKYLKHAAELTQEMMQQPDVESVFGRIHGQAMFASARKSVGGMFIAIDPQQEDVNNNLFLQAMISGGMLATHSDKGILLGVDLARKLKLDLGKKLVYTTTDKNGEIVSAIARVSGLFQTGAIEIDGAMAILPLQAAQQILGYQADEVSVLAVTLSDQRNSYLLRDKLQKMTAFKNVEVLNWQQTQPELAGMIAIDKSSNYISQLLIAMLVAAGILNTMLMSVLDRKREFGVMMALGMSPRNLFLLVMIESFWLAILGLIIGVIVTIPWYVFMTGTGIDLSAAYGEGFSFGGVLLDPVFKIRLFKESIIAILIGLFGLALLAGAYPAWRAGRIAPIESLKAL
ncbi:MAG: ABC-type lipoprotein release transport system permease subunit [Methylophagaceae bacterium]|jgi:ABC-type lipoprotein release transport system permease subunit